jgi:hypothetical protein
MRTHLRMLWLVALALSALPGCSTLRTTDPGRTATEQFLMSEAIGRAVQQLSADAMRDRTVYVDAAYLGGEMRGFLLGSLRAHLLLAGALLVDSGERAEVIIEVRSGAVGIDRTNFLLGIPPVVIPSVATEDVADGVAFITPELAFIKNVKQAGLADVAFIAYWADTREVLASSGPYVGRTYRHDWWFFGFGPYTWGNIVPAEKGTEAD